jgi:hypothetical protein
VLVARKNKHRPQGASAIVTSVQSACGVQCIALFFIPLSRGGKSARSAEVSAQRNLCPGVSLRFVSVRSQVQGTVFNIPLWGRHPTPEHYKTRALVWQVTKGRERSKKREMIFGRDAFPGQEPDLYYFQFPQRLFRSSGRSGRRRYYVLNFSALQLCWFCNIQ